MNRLDKKTDEQEPKDWGTGLRIFLIPGAGTEVLMKPVTSNGSIQHWVVTIPNDNKAIAGIVNKLRMEQLILLE